MEKNDYKTPLGALGVMTASAVIAFGGGVLVGGSIETSFETRRVHNVSASVIETDSLLNVMSIYGPSFRDEILVESPDSAGVYIPLRNYLESNFNNEPERNLRRAEIEYRISEHERGNQ